jgi:hypothetical protein
VDAELRYGRTPGRDRLTMHVRLGRVPTGLDPMHTDIQLTVSDDDDILTVTFPAGALTPAGKGMYVLRQPIGSVRDARLAIRKHGASLRLATAPTDLSHADRSEHMVTVALAAGVYRASHTRLWVLRGDRLTPGGR